MKTKELKIFALIWSAILSVLWLFENVNIFLYIAILFLVVGLLKPTLITDFYKIWIKFGEFMGGIMSKVILFVLYFGLFMPISFILKILGKDLLNKKLDRSKESYWAERETQPQSMKNQF